MSALEAHPPAAAPHCALHPERPALAACQRCGTFVCAEEHRVRDGIIHCAGCSDRPESDPVEVYRARHWGRPDIWGWMVGVSALPQAAITYLAVVQHLGPTWIGVNAAMLVLDVCYFLGQRWTRYAVLLTPLAILLPNPDSGAQLAAAGAEGMGGLVLAMKVVCGLLAAAMVAVMFYDVRNQLFFRIEVPRPRLVAAHATYADNRIAIWGTVIAGAGFVIPGLSVAALPMLITSWIRAGQPGALRIERRGLTLAGLALAAVATVFWIGVTVLLVWLTRQFDPSQLK